MKFLIVASFLIIFGLALAAPSYHHNEDHETKYIVVTKQEVNAQNNWQSKDEDLASSSHGSHIGYEILSTQHSDHTEGHDDNDKDAKYEFKYGVKDLKTGDIKNQWEHRDGDHVQGTYSFIEADGTTRLVEYSADDHNGFNAVVKKIGQSEHPVVNTKSIDQAKWKGDHSFKVHDRVSQGHATSYVNVKHH